MARHDLWQQCVLVRPPHGVYDHVRSMCRKRYPVAKLESDLGFGFTLNMVLRGSLSHHENYTNQFLLTGIGGSPLASHIIKVLPPNIVKVKFSAYGTFSHPCKLYPE